MRYNNISFISAICWLSLWIGVVLTGASYLYAKLQGKEFLVGLSKGWFNAISPDSTLALMLSIGMTLILIGFLFVAFYYFATFIAAFVKVLTRIPIRI
ncbi:MAG TPA: hypothetical protein ACHBZ9_07965 [Arsenophonus nasoniae]|uniref:hypothetical protein n=1 Tax=Arsenophonus nasoniae TaxID=638 RepID=UPI003879169C